MKGMKDVLTENAKFIDREIAWFREVLDLRFQQHVEGRHGHDFVFRVDPPSLPKGSVPYADIIRRYEMGPPERLILILAYLPYIRPEALDPFLVQNEALGRRFTEFGGHVGSTHLGFLPTAETALFLLAGTHTKQRLEFLPLFDSSSYLYRENILRVGHERNDEPPLATVLQLSAGFLEKLTTGGDYWPPFSSEFPAQRITTTYEWDELVVEPDTRREIEDILNWVRFKDELLEDWRLGLRIKPGFRSLFYGPPGTGKTLTAALLGKVTGIPVFRIDLSKVTSKYIGETEKNLARLFDLAENQGWILFFDEADSLFSKRTETRNSNDRSANQQVSFLLQRIEDFPGVVILASNFRSQVDEAFARRFQSMIHFNIPAFPERLKLWEDHFRHKHYRLAPDVDLSALARDYDLSGGSIINVLRYVCLQAIARGSVEIQWTDLLRAVRSEQHKEGKFISGSSSH